MLWIHAFSLDVSSPQRHRYSPARWAPLTVLRAMCEALHEGLAMHRQYEALRSKGVAHDAALRRALTIGVPARHMSGTIGPAHFARWAERAGPKQCPHAGTPRLV